MDPMSSSSSSSSIFTGRSGNEDAQIVKIDPCGHQLVESIVVKCLLADQLCPIDKQKIQGYFPVNNSDVQLSSMFLENSPCKPLENLCLASSIVENRETVLEHSSVYWEEQPCTNAIQQEIDQLINLSENLFQEVLPSMVERNVFYKSLCELPQGQYEVSQFSHDGRYVFTLRGTPTALHVSTMTDLTDIQLATYKVCDTGTTVFTPSVSLIRKIVFGVNDEDFHVWDYANLKQVKHYCLPHIGRPSWTSLSSNGKVGLCPQIWGNAPTVFDLDNLNAIKFYPLPPRDENNTAHKGFISPSGSYALIGSGPSFTSSDNHEILLWDLRDLESIRSYSVSIEGGLHHAAWGQMDNFILINTLTGSLILLDFANLEEMATYPLCGHKEAYIHSGCFSPDSQFIITSFGDKTARIWDIRNPTQIEFYPLRGHVKDVRNAIFSPNGNFALTISDDATLLWDVRNLNQIRCKPFIGVSSFCRSAAGFSPNGRYVIINHIIFDLFEESGMSWHQFLAIKRLQRLKAEKKPVEAKKLFKTKFYQDLFMSLTPEERRNIENWLDCYNQNAKLRLQQVYNC